MRSAHALSNFGCAQMCDGHAQCGGYCHRAGAKRCFLHDNGDVIVDLIQDEGIISGLSCYRWIGESKLEKLYNYVDLDLTQDVFDALFQRRK